MDSLTEFYVVEDSQFEGSQLLELNGPSVLKSSEWKLSCVFERDLLIDDLDAHETILFNPLDGGTWQVDKSECFD